MEVFVRNGVIVSHGKCKLTKPDLYFVHHADRVCVLSVQMPENISSNRNIPLWLFLMTSDIFPSKQTLQIYSVSNDL